MNVPDASMLLLVVNVKLVLRFVEEDDATAFTKAQLFVCLPDGSDAADIGFNPNSCFLVLLCN